jgi:hypothetical protein
MFENVAQNLKMVKRTSVLKTAPPVGPAQVKETRQSQIGICPLHWSPPSEVYRKC